MAAELTSEYDERTSITMFQSIFVVIGGLIPPFIHSELVETFRYASSDEEHLVNYQVSELITYSSRSLY